MGFLDNRRRILDKLAEGMTRQEILTNYSKESPGQSGKIAFAIASVPAPSLQKKYSPVNFLLFSLLIGYSSLTLYQSLPGGTEPLFRLVLQTVIPLIFSFYVYYFHGGIYRLLLIWCCIELAGVFYREPLSVSIFFLTAILLLSLFLSIKIFPHCGILGPKRDAMGNYRLE